MSDYRIPHIEVSIPWKDIDLVNRSLGNFKQRFGEEVATLSGEILDELKSRTPRSKKSEPGYTNLADAWRVERKDREGALEKLIFHNISPHNNVLLYLEYGTVPHVIEGNPILCFEVDGKIIFSRRVYHPGTKAYNIIGGMIGNVSELVSAIQDSVIQKLQKEMRGEQ